MRGVGGRGECVWVGDTSLSPVALEYCSGQIGPLPSSGCLDVWGGCVYGGDVCVCGCVCVWDVCVGGVYVCGCMCVCGCTDMCVGVDMSV